MKITVLGGGPGSLAMAAHLATQGHSVRFWGRNRKKLAWLHESREVVLTGAIDETVKLAGVCSSLPEAISGAEIVFVPLPAPAHEGIGHSLAALAEPGQLFVTSSMSGLGSVVLNKAFRAGGCTHALTAELPGLPYGARFAGEGIVNVPLVADISLNNVYGRGVGVFPNTNRQPALDLLSGAYPGVYPAENALACAFQAWGPVIHPTLMILNLTSIENACFWDPHEEGTTPSVYRVVEAVDGERKALQEAWGFRVTDSKVVGEYYKGERKVYDVWPNFRAQMERWAWKDRLDVNHRYLTEDAKYGMVLRLSSGRLTETDMPLTESVVRLGSVLSRDDFLRSGRTLEAVGLGAADRSQVLEILERGWDSV